MSDNTNTFHGARVLITGGLGFIGSMLARRLVELGAHVTLVDSLIPIYGGNMRNVAGIADQVKVNIADVRDEYSMDYLVQGQDFLLTWPAKPRTSIRCATRTPIWRSTAGRSFRSWRPAASTILA